MATLARDAISRDQTRHRRWRIPPPFLRGSEPIEGSGVLDEVPGPLGLLLWQTVRDVTLWAMTPGEAREGLFTPDAEARRLAWLHSVGEAARDIDGALRATAALLAHPADMAPEAVLTACQRISQWAEFGGAPATALAFAQAGALAVPDSARAALRVGRLARQRGEYPRAEGWLQRSIVLARQFRERETHAWGYTSLGQVYSMRGNFPAAERLHLRALRIARRFSLISREAAALHDLFSVAVDRERFQEALDWARAAAAAYGPRHPALPFLAHDVGVLWIETGRHSAALPVLAAVVDRIDAPRNVLAYANLVRAAGGCGDRARFTAHWAPTFDLAVSGKVPHLAPTALLNLARGAASLGETEQAREAAQQAIRWAERVSEGKTVFQAESLLGSLASDDALRRATVAPVEADELTDALVGELVAALTLAKA